MATKLYELLAVEGNLNGQADKTRGDLGNTFSKKPHLFGQKLVTFTPVAGDTPATVEEQSEIVTTVPKELHWFTSLWSKGIDVGFQICEANTRARADIEIDGTIIARDVPATALMQLAHRLTEYHGLIVQIPTLDPAKGFKPDTAKGGGIYVARESQRDRTEKVQEPIELAKATDKHAAQVQLISRDKKVGTVQTMEWSALLTPATKSELIERCETMQRAVKSALSRANAIEIDLDRKVADTMFTYMLSPLTAKAAK